MRIVSIAIIFWIIFTFPDLVTPSQVLDPVIDEPRPGGVLQGLAVISGSSNVSGFLSAEISFSYMDDPTGTWFLIGTNSQPVSSDTLITWDTTVITDGNYKIRLRVFLTVGSFRDFLVSGLRVRNYTPIETPTHLPPAPVPTHNPTITPTMIPYPTPTSLPRNPATLALKDVSISILYGGFASILIFIIIGIYLWLRRK
jgi:hypothetical protein